MWVFDGIHSIVGLLQHQSTSPTMGLTFTQIGLRNSALFFFYALQRFIISRMIMFHLMSKKNSRFLLKMHHKDMLQ